MSNYYYDGMDTILPEVQDFFLIQCTVEEVPEQVLLLSFLHTGKCSLHAFLSPLLEFPHTHGPSCKRQDGKYLAFVTMML